MKPQDNRINWIDVETTGLHDTCLLLEVGIIVTDNNLNRLDAAKMVLHHPIEAVMADMDDWCIKTHTASGLVEEVAHHGSKPEVVERVLLDTMERCQSVGAILGGSTVHFDRAVLKRHLPEVEKALHYRNFDVTSLKQAVTRWWPDVPQRRLFGEPIKDAHRAIPDIEESIRHAQVIRDMLMLHPRALELAEGEEGGRPYMK